MRRFSIKGFQYLIVGFFFILFGMSKTHAHPHAFVGLKAELISTDSALQALKMRWIFDEMSSASVIYDLKSNQNDPNYRSQLIEDMMENIVENHYFTELSTNHVQLTFNKNPVDVELKEDQLQLILNFTAPLAAPLPFQHQKLKLKIYEPSFYVDMTFPAETEIVLSNAMNQDCTVRLLLPKQDKALEDYALSLDFDAQPNPDFNLGAAFAQQVFITCR